MKKIYTLAGGILLASASFAQAPFMTNNFTYAPGEKHAPHAISTIDGRRVDADDDRVVYYSQDFDAGFDGWVDAIIEGPVGFKLTSTGHENDPANTFQIPTLETSTPDQWVLIDSDGDNASYGVAESATLTSPELDLSAAAGNFVALTFEQFFAEWQPAETEDHCYLGVSTDDGATWVEVEINEGVGREARPNPEYMSWDITDYIEGMESSVYIRFRWEGAWNYGWQIDNISIEDINEKDIALVDTYRTYDGGIVYSQIAQAQTQEFIVGAIIKNTGHIEQTNVRFAYTISDPDGTEVASGETIDNIPSLLNGEQDTLLFETGYIPTTLGNYVITWEALSDEGDDETADNMATDDHFMLTEFTMALDYDEGPVGEISNWPLKTGEGYFGNLMTFEAAGVVTSMQVQLTNYTENLGEVFKVAVWEFFDGVGWSIVYDSDEHSITEADLGNFVNFDTEEFEVNTEATYVFCTYQYNSAPQPMFVQQGDIGFNNVQGFDDESLARGFFNRSAPVVRVSLNPGEVSVDNNEITEYFSVYPNPATDILNVNVSLNNSAQTTVNVMDITGKVVSTLDLGLVNGATQVAIDLNDYTAGVYFIELVNAEGKQVRKFVKK